MHYHAQLIQTFYESFKKLDAEGMQKCYHSDIHFSDPVFPSLKGKEASAMWAMLIENLKKSNNPWRLEFSQIEANDVEGSSHWEAYYILSATGRMVHNIIEAKFQFKDGLIIRHIDQFDFYRWARLGFGVTGMLMGWTPFFRDKVQSKVKFQLEKYLSKSKL
jgi:hypothetical protein